MSIAARPMFSAMLRAKGTGPLSLFADWGSSIQRIFGNMMRMGMSAPDFMGMFIGVLK